MNLVEKLLVGSYTFKLGEFYNTFPKIAPIMFVGSMLSGLFQPDLFNNLPLFILGLTLVCVGLLGFFYHNIFPSKKPNTKEEAEKFNTRLF